MLSKQKITGGGSLTSEERHIIYYRISAVGNDPRNDSDAPIVNCERNDNDTQMANGIIYIFLNETNGDRIFILLFHFVFFFNSQKNQMSHILMQIPKHQAVLTHVWVS